MCNIEFPHFGASYPDAHCIDGYLWDMDSYEDGVYTIGGDDPCPFCNTEEWLKEAMKERVPVSSSLGTREEQKPAEWSEEDERILKGIIGKIDHDQTYGVSKAEMLSFLEGLRPSWKPREEDQHQKEQVLNAFRLELSKWLNHSVRGIKSGNPAYFQGKITLIHDLLGFIHDIDNPEG